MAKTVEADMNIYHFNNVTRPWGDWGTVLAYGMIGWDEDTDIDSIERSGPYTPLAYIRSGVLVLTQAIKDALESSDLKGISRFEHLEKTHVVELEWQHWDTRQAITEHLDLDGEPESIIHSRPHDPELARRMPEYWQAFVVGKLSLRKDHEKQQSELSQYLQVLKVDDKADFFKADTYGGYFLNERAKHWLETNCPDCFDFTLIPPAT